MIKLWNSCYMLQELEIFNFSRPGLFNIALSLPLPSHVTASKRDIIISLSSEHLPLSKHCWRPEPKLNQSGLYLSTYVANRIDSCFAYTEFQLSTKGFIRLYVHMYGYAATRVLMVIVQRYNHNHRIIGDRANVWNNDSSLCDN